jgi:hypothetical protein
MTVGMFGKEIRRAAVSCTLQVTYLSSWHPFISPNARSNTG